MSEFTIIKGNTSITRVGRLRWAFQPELGCFPGLDGSFRWFSLVAVMVDMR